MLSEVQLGNFQHKTGLWKIKEIISYDYSLLCNYKSNKSRFVKEAIGVNLNKKPRRNYFDLRYFTHTLLCTIIDIPNSAVFSYH
jgi:hypothetical protein